MSVTEIVTVVSVVLPPSVARIVMSWLVALSKSSDCPPRERHLTRGGVNLEEPSGIVDQ